MTKRYVTVRVTQEHIAAGRPKNATSCALALAIREAGYPAAYFYNDRWFPKGLGWDWPRIPPRVTRRACRFGEDFDAGKPVQPATFRLPLR